MILNYFFKQISGALAVLLILNTNIMANEQPDYKVIKKDNEFEIRQYTNFLTATVETEGERDDAIGKGFRILFKYISGENKNKESISMTVPVMQKSSGNNKWSISFVVPKKFNLQNVPQPDNQSVKIKNNPDLKVIVITFSGLFSNENIKENEAKIIDAFTKREVSEKLRRINKSLLNDEEMEAALGFTIDIPSAYKITKNQDNFYWIRKEFSSSKTLDLMFYSYPLDGIRKSDSTVVDVINMRNKMVKDGIDGEDGIIMTTENAYAPSIFKAIIDNKPAYETRGIWKIEGAYMGGPFVNYAIEDKVNNRYLVAEGYVYAPSLDKREYVFELEAIIKSIKIK